VPAEVQRQVLSKSNDELAYEVVSFLRKEFPEGIDPVSSWRATQLFWEKKGLRFADDPALRLKMQKVDALVRKKMEKQQIEKEKQILPKLVEKCVKWAMENNLKRVTKSNFDYFLTEKEIQLSRTSKDALYNQVNFMLQKE
jgi:hypothetical protein